MRNDQKVAVITGASQGHGAALVTTYRDCDIGSTRLRADRRTVGSMTKSSRSPATSPSSRTAERAISEGVARFGRIDSW